MKVEPCKFCGYLPNTMPPIQRKNDDHVWICPACGNQGDADVTPWKGPPVEYDSTIKVANETRKPMTESLETK